MYQILEWKNNLGISFCVLKLDHHEIANVYVLYHSWNKQLRRRCLGNKSQLSLDLDVETGQLDGKFENEDVLNRSYFILSPSDKFGLDSNSL